eukprot:TRINITY_DN8565_c1_g1_i1.p1 TRINITY_DN8565_c1_g1~~TRINITY_DN8565_c1_g1_i1.p1  ORF type:complete len:379 (+),score=94.36 TRINITY_DN8565_c1_g1_i1:54-1139(+)
MKLTRVCQAAKKIVVLRGDGVGPEIMEEGLKVLKATGAELEFDEALIGGAAIDAVNDPLPEETIAKCKAASGMLLGAVGGPKWDGGKIRPEQGLLKIRKEMQLFANLRPVKLHDPLLDACPLRRDIVKGTDMIVVRELTGGLYFGPREEHNGTGKALDTLPYTTEEIARIVRVAAGIAMQRSKRLLSVDKANVLATSRLWRKVATDVVTEEFPEIELSHGLVDSVAMDIIKKPSTMDVIVTENLFGDILSDETSVLSGSLGLLPSASFGAPGSPGLYEPIHGSAPDIAGKGVVNPIAMILSCAMLLRSIDLPAEAAKLESAVDAALHNDIFTVDILPAGSAAKPVSTSEMGSWIADKVASM